jgi:hypothetical protein
MHRLGTWARTPEQLYFMNPQLLPNIKIFKEGFCNGLCRN